MRRVLRTSFLVFLALAGLGAAAAVVLLGYRPDRLRYPVRGIDVSSHQGHVDWPRVASDDIGFAYIKATEGGDYRDPRFAQNWKGARQAGLKVGAYHYFTFCRPGLDQARNFLSMKPATLDALPPAVDLEFDGNCRARPVPAALARELDQFLAAVETQTGKPAVLYMTTEFEQAYPDIADRRRLWRRSLFHQPDRARPWTFWQYHFRGRVKGIDGPVDLNVFSGDRRAFAAFASQGH